MISIKLGLHTITINYHQANDNSNIAFPHPNHSSLLTSTTPGLQVQIKKFLESTSHRISSHQLTSQATIQNYFFEINAMEFITFIGDTLTLLNVFGL